MASDSGPSPFVFDRLVRPGQWMPQWPLTFSTAPKEASGPRVIERRGSCESERRPTPK
jgi:hypothetical protein